MLVSNLYVATFLVSDHIFFFYFFEKKRRKKGKMILFTSGIKKKEREFDKRPWE